MARTIRKRWITDPKPEAPGAEWRTRLTDEREATCKPGCIVCGKPQAKAERRRFRRNKRADINERRFDG